MDETISGSGGVEGDANCPHKPVCIGDIILVYDDTPKYLGSAKDHVQSGNGCTVLKCPVQHFFP